LAEEHDESMMGRSLLRDCTDFAKRRNADDIASDFISRERLQGDIPSSEPHRRPIEHRRQVLQNRGAFIDLNASKILSINASFFADNGIYRSHCAMIAKGVSKAGDSFSTFKFNNLKSLSMIK
jgi:hypothetical protein